MMADAATTPIITPRDCVSPTQSNNTAADNNSKPTNRRRVPGRAAAATAPTQAMP